MPLRLTPTVSALVAGACLWAGAVAAGGAAPGSAAPDGQGATARAAGVLTPGHYRAAATRLRAVDPHR